MSDDREVPTSRLGRLARLAALGAHTGVSLVTSRDGREAAAQAAQVLGHLRGLAAKLGQMASYIDGLAPPGYEEQFQAALKKLLDKAPPLSAEASVQVVEAELGV